MAKQHPMYNTIALLRDGEPFKPFEVQMSSGRAIEVSRAEAIAMDPKSDVVLLFDRAGLPHMVNPRTINAVTWRNGKSSKGHSNN